jgi:hypothetical protein
MLTFTSLLKPFILMSEPPTKLKSLNEKFLILNNPFFASILSNLKSFENSLFY